MADKPEARKRKRMVPTNGREAFEVRIAYWFDDKGAAWITARLESDLGPDGEMPPRHEVVGVVHEGLAILRGRYDEDE